MGDKPRAVGAAGAADSAVESGSAEAGPVFYLAPWIQRVAAALVDFGIFYGLIAVGYLADALVGTSFFVVVSRIAALAFVLWNFLYLSGTTGQTVGRWVLRIRLVAMVDAKPIGLLRAAWRLVLHVLDVPGFLGFLLPLVDKQRQTLADKVAKTVVIRVAKG